MASPNSSKLHSRLGGLSIQSKLLIILLLVSLLAAAIVGWIGYKNGRDSLRQAEFDQLISIREMAVDEGITYLRDAEGGVLLQSGNLTAQNAVKAFSDGWDQLQAQPLDPTAAAGLETYYADVFMPEYNAKTGRDQSPTSLMPASNAGKYLQYYYTSKAAELEDPLQYDDAGDGSAWSAAHVQYHDYFKRLIDSLHYEDVLVVDDDGNIVYSAYKRTDLGSSLTEGPYKESSLAEAYREAMATGDVNTVVLEDLQPWAPEYDRPVIWIVSPVGNDDALDGALVAQISLDQVNRVVTGDGNWEEQGLGKTGEVYFAGRDQLMRSASRAMIEDPDTYVEKVTANGTPPEIAEEVIERHQSSGIQPVNTYAVEHALAGETGVAVAKEYIGDQSVVAYAPVNVGGLDWVVVARIEASEAFQPVAAFERSLLLWTLAILIAVSLLSLLVAQVFTRPIRRLADAADSVAAGDYDVEVPAGSRDEFGELGAAFNNMAQSLRVKQDLIDQQRAENAKLMNTLMPESVAQRYLKGEAAISETHDDVAVVYSELVGLDEYAKTLSPEQEVTQLNTLLSGFDSAAEAAGIESVRTLRNGYLAASGITIRRIDNSRRAVDFAIEMRKIVERFNAQEGTSIDVRAGVDSGVVTSGLVERTNMAYDLWGDAVSLAYMARNVSKDPGIYVSQEVHDTLQDLYTFTEAGTVELNGTPQTVWQVVTK